MAASSHRRKSSAEMDEYQRSMHEFREMLERVGHKAAHRLKHPRFIENNDDTRRRQRH